MNKNKFLTALLAAVLPLTGFLSGQGKPGQDLWSLWRTGFEKYEAAEKAAKRNGGEDEAVRLYRESHQVFLKIKKDAPSWNREVINYRISLCVRKMAEIQKPREEALRRVAEEKKSESIRLREEVRVLKDQLAKSRAEAIASGHAVRRAEAAETQSRKLMDENLQLNRKIAAVQLLLDDTREKLKKADRSAEFQEKLLREKTIGERLEQRLKESYAEVDALKRKVDRLTTERLESDVKARESSEQLKSMRELLKSKDSVEKRNTELVSSAETQQKELDNLKKQLAESARKNAALAEQVEEYRSGRTVLPSARKMEEELRTEKSKSEYTKNLADQLEKENTALKKRNDELVAEKQKLVLELVRGTETIQKQKKGLEEAAPLPGRISAMIQEVNALKTEKETLKKELDALSVKSEEQRKQIVSSTRLASRLADAHEQLKKTEKLAGESAKVIDSLQEQNSELQRKNAALVQEKLAAEKSSAEKLAEAVRKLSILEKQLAAKTADDDRKLTDAVNRTAALEKQLAEAKKAAANSKEKEQMNKRIAELTSSLASAKKQVDDAAGKAQIRELTGKVASLEKQLEDAKKSDRTTVLKTQNSELIGKVASLEKQLADMKKDTAQKAGEKEDVARLTARIARLEVQLKAAKVKKTEPVVTIEENNADKESLAKMKQLLDRKNAALKYNVEKIEALNAAVAEKERTIAELKKSSSDSGKATDSNIRQLRKELASLQNEQVRQTEELVKLSRENRTLSLKLASSVQKTEYTRVSSELNDRNAELKRLQERSRQDAEAREAEKRLADSTIQELKLRIKEHQSAADKTAKGEIARLNTAVNELMEGKNQYEAVIRKLTENNKALRKESDEVKRQLSAVKSELAVAKEKLAAPKVDNEALRRADEMLKRADKYEALYRSSLRDIEQRKERIRILEESLKRSSGEAADARLVAERYRKELLNWSGDPDGVDQKLLQKKDQAIDDLIREGVELRKELSMLKSELLMARDEVRRTRDLSAKAAQNFYRLRLENTRLRTRILEESDGKAVFAKIPPVPDEVLAHMKKAAESALGKKDMDAASPAAASTASTVPEKKSTAVVSAEDEKEFKESMASALKSERAGDWSAALLNYWRAVDINPAAYEAQLGLVRSYLARKEKDSAAKAYAKAIELGAPKDAELEKQLK